MSIDAKLVTTYTASEVMPATEEQVHDLKVNLINELMVNRKEFGTASLALYDTFIFAWKNTVDGKVKITFWICRQYTKEEYEF